MGQKYSSQSTSGYASASPPDDGSQVAANLITWSGVRTKLTDVLKTFAEAINTALVSALDLSARAISSNDTAIASDHWKTLQVTGATTIQLSSAASMGAGYEVGIFNAGVGVVTVTPAGADTINGASASVTVAVKGSMIFRTNQALTGYNVVGNSQPSTGGASFVYGTGIADFGRITKRKTADESVTSSTALQDDDHLTFAIAANEEWVAEFYISAGNLLSTTGFRVAITVPSGATLQAAAEHNANAVGITISAQQTTSGTAIIAPTPASGTSTNIQVHAWVLNGATPGNVTLQWAQGTNSGSALTFFKGSHMQATRIA